MSLPAISWLGVVQGICSEGLRPLIEVGILSSKPIFFPKVGQVSFPTLHNPIRVTIISRQTRINQTPKGPG